MTTVTRPFRFGAQLARARSRAEWVATARRVEDMGYSTLFMPDHFDDQLAPVPALMAAADATTSLRVGALVFDNDYRHPVVLAKEAATIDVLSCGRLELGLGAGWLRSDYDESGITFDPAPVRIDRMAEAVTVMKGCWSGERFSFSGDHYSIAAHHGTPAPVQRPHPPLVIGGGGRRVLSLAAREADVVSVNFDLRSGRVSPDLGSTATEEATACKIAWIREAAGGRFPQIELSTTCFFVSVTDDRDSMAAAAGAAFGVSSEQVLGVPHVLVGSTAAICDTLRERREMFGFSYVVFSGGTDEVMAPVVAELAGT